MDDYSLSGYRIYQKSFNGQASASWTNIYDANWVWNNGTNLTTGAWRPLFPSDLAANISVSGLSLTVGAVAVTGNPIVTLTGNQNVNIINSVLAVSGALSASINSIAITGNPQVQVSNFPVISLWQKVGTSGFVQSFNPISGNCLIQAVNGYSQCNNNTEFLQVFDGLLQTGFPIESLIVMSGNNFFFQFPDDGVQFQSGFTIANSLDPINITKGGADFIATVLYKML